VPGLVQRTKIVLGPLWPCRGALRNCLEAWRNPEIVLDLIRNTKLELCFIGRFSKPADGRGKVLRDTGSI
jgi:hypothetical protein